MDNEKSAGRRGFLLGVLTAMGATTATVLAARTYETNKDGVIDSDASTGPILYQRTEETERYYKTLYT